jgi:hypothetical protein
MKFVAIGFLGGFCASGIVGAQADEAAQCQANGGTYVIGHVMQAPSFVPGHLRHGVELSHTHLTLLADQNRQTYDVAIDNVFAAGYDTAGENVPTPLSTIAVGDLLELCGKLYRSGAPGIDWVHTDCGAQPIDRMVGSRFLLRTARRAPILRALGNIVCSGGEPPPASHPSAWPGAADRVGR